MSGCHFLFRYKNVNFLDYSTVYFEFSRIDKHSLKYRGQNYIGNEIKGNKNCFESVGGSSYQEFVLPRRPRRSMYNRTTRENDFGSSYYLRRSN